MTIIKQASVKVMLSYDYSHFESSMSVENDLGLSMSDIDNARKNCQRICDKAVKQYKKAKDFAMLRNDGQYKMQNFESQCKTIENKAEGDRTINEIAMLKEYKDESWRNKFLYAYDYEDDD